MRDLKIKPGMDTPKAKQKNPAPKDAESILKKHMDERQTEKEPENRDPVHYATDRVEGNMRRGAAAAANSSRRMIKRYREKQRQGKEYVKQIYKTGGAATVESDPHNPAAQYDNLSPSTSVRSEAGSYPIESSQDAEATPPRERGRQKLCKTQRPLIGGILPKKERQSGALHHRSLTVAVRWPLRKKAIRGRRLRVTLSQRMEDPWLGPHAPCV